MEWEGREESENVEDRRAFGPKTLAIGGGVGGLIILIHPYIDGPNSVAQRHHLRSVVLIAFLSFVANNLIPNYNSLAAPASPVVQNADRDLLAQTCTRLC